MAWYGIPMQNIEHFNLYTAHIFNVLLDVFPMQKALDAKRHRRSDEGHGPNRSA